jgi:hypothetical protein
MPSGNLPEEQVSCSTGLGPSIIEIITWVSIPLAEGPTLALFAELRRQLDIPAEERIAIRRSIRDGDKMKVLVRRG